MKKALKFKLSKKRKVKKKQGRGGLLLSSRKKNKGNWSQKVMDCWIRDEAEVVLTVNGNNDSHCQND